MPLISSIADGHYEDMEPIKNPQPIKRKICPVCYNTQPIWLYVDDYGDVVGCDSCLRAEYVGEQ